MGALGKENSSIILEAAASFDTTIGHCFVGLPGSNNDINVIDSPLISAMVNGKFIQCNYTINGNNHDTTYMLAVSNDT